MANYQKLDNQFELIESDFKSVINERKPVKFAGVVRPDPESDHPRSTGQIQSVHANQDICLMLYAKVEKPNFPGVSTGQTRRLIGSGPKAETVSPGEPSNGMDLVPIT